MKAVAAGRFTCIGPSDIHRELRFYIAWVEDDLRRLGQHAETVGILLCGDRNDRVVRYSLARSTAPLAVASYDALPPAARDEVPSTDELADALSDAPSQGSVCSRGSGRGPGRTLRWWHRGC